MDTSFPFYVIKRKGKLTVFSSPYLKDITHPTLWKLVSRVVAAEYGLKFNDIIELPYCQVRGRVVGTKIYIGEITKTVRKLLRSHFKGYEIVYDDHENMTLEDIRSFESLRVGPTMSKALGLEAH